MIRQKGNDEGWFVLQLSRIASTIDNVYYDDIEKHLGKHIVKVLLISWKISLTVKTSDTTSAV
jgi:hypothetical protein